MYPCLCTPLRYPSFCFLTFDHQSSFLAPNSSKQKQELWDGVQSDAQENLSVQVRTEEQENIEE